MHLVGFIIRIYHDARLHERQIQKLVSIITNTFMNHPTFFFFQGMHQNGKMTLHKKLFKITNLMKSTYLTVTMTDNATLYHNLGIRM